MLKHKKYLTLLLLPFSFVLTFLAKLSPSFTDKYYSRGVYRWFTEILGRITSFFPFSIGEILIYLLIIAIILLTVRLVVRLVKNKGKRRAILTKTIGNLAISVSLVYFLFTIFTGINYHRTSYKDVLGLDVKKSSKEELAEMCSWLIYEANSSKNNSINVASADTFADLTKETKQLYDSFGTKENGLDGFTPRAKGVLSSRAMSYTNITGNFFPFTLECNVNTDVMSFSLPFTTLHELAHFKGYMNESETNFIAFLVGVSSDNPHFNYSVYYSALSYTLSAYYKVATPEEYSAMVALIDSSVLKDFALNSEYWKQFQTPIAEISTKTNDAYLKAQGQSAGVNSYGQMVDLLLAYYKQTIKP